MKLDFSELTPPPAKARGQVGTTGTPASTRVFASPLVQTGAGTAGDKLVAAALVRDLRMVAPSACPPASPICPQAAAPEKLNADAVSPVSPLVPFEMTEGSAASPGEHEHMAEAPTGPRAETCCASVAVRLLTAEGGGFGAISPADRCGATGKCHLAGWDSAEIASFTARAERFALLGQADAEDQAERLRLRDREGDDRRLCLECTWLGDTGRCLAAATGRLAGVSARLEPVRTLLQRCEAFGLRKGLV